MHTYPGINDNNAVPSGAATTKYYSRPDFSSENQKYEQDIRAKKDTMSQREIAMSKAGERLQNTANALYLLQRQAERIAKSGDTSGRLAGIQEKYDSLYKQYRIQRLESAAAEDGYKRSQAGYNKTLDDYKKLLKEQEQSVQAWRSTIRDSASVQAELDDVRSQIQELQRGGNKNSFIASLGNAVKNAMASSSGFAVPGQQHEMQNAEQITQLQEREKLLQEEYQWGKQFETEALVGSEFFKTSAAAGLQAYKGQKAAAQAKAARDAEGKTLWQKVLENNAKAYGMSSDTPVNVVFNQSAQQYREDTSYREPSDKWSKDQLNMFGYYYSSDPAKAYEYAEKVNNEINRGEAQQKKDAIVQKATATLGSGAAHTLGALAAAPTAMADVMDNLAEFAGRGTVTSKNVVTPYDYSQAVVGGISQKLNEYGTIDQDMPVIGGKGLGDLYSIGFSVAQSLLAGTTKSEALTMLQFMGQGAAAGIDAGIESGAKGWQAMTYGLISGAAEGFAEKIGVDNLMKLGSARTFKGFVKNLLKQSAAEGIEETATSVIDSAADRLILGENSTFRKNVAEYEQSMSHDNAVRLAWTELIGGIVFDGLSGAISGGIGAGIRTSGVNVMGSLQKHQTTDKQAQKTAPAASVTVQETAQQQVTEKQSGKKAAQAGTEGATPKVETQDRANPFHSEIQRQIQGDRQAGNDKIGGIDNGSETEGNRVLDGGSQRDVGAGAGEQVGQLDGSAAAEQKRARINSQRASIDRQARIRSLRLPKVSSLELGVSSGTEAKTVSVVPQEYWDDAMVQLEARIHNETGVHATFVSGKMQVQTKHGVANISGAYEGDRIIVQVDSMKASVEQLADHEAFHKKMTWDDRGVLRNEVRELVRQQYTAEQYEEALTKYILAMDGAYANEDGNFDYADEQVLRKIEEDLLADAYAGINSFGAHAEKFSDAVNTVMNRNGVGKMMQQENGVRETNGPPVQNESSTGEGGVRYAVESTPDGRKYVRADRQVIFGNDPDGWSNQVEDYINGKIRKGKDVAVVAENGDILMLTADTAGKLADNHTGRGTTMDDESFYVKANAAVHIDELAQISRRGEDRADKGSRHGAFASGGWNYRTVFFEDFDGKYYRLRISVAKNAAGETVYNIGDIEERSRPTVYGSSAKSSALGGKASSEKMIPQDNLDVKGHYSFDGSEEAETQVRVAKESLQKDLAKQLGLSSDQEATAKELIDKYSREVAKKSKPRLTQEEKIQRKADRKAMIDALPEVRRMRADKAKPTAESKPFLAKGQLKKIVKEQFQLPEGSIAVVNDILEHFADRVLKKEQISYDDVQGLFDVLVDTGVATIAADEYFADVSRRLSRSKIYVSDSLRTDFGDDYAELRRRAFAVGICLTDNAADGGVDMWNHDLAADLPGLFYANDTDERAILERIIQLAEEGQDEKMSLREYAASLSESHGDLSEEEFLRDMERKLEHALDTFAKAAEIEIKLRERTGIKIAQERDVVKQRAARRQALEEQRQLQERRDRLRNQQQKRQLQELQKKTLKQLQWLNKNRRKFGDDLLSEMDEEEQRIFRDVVSDLDVYAIGAADAMRWSGKMQCTWVDAVEMYDKAKAADPNFFESAELERMAMRLRGKKIDSLSIEDLNSVYKLLTGLRTAFYNKQNLIKDELHRAVAEVYMDSVEEIRRADPGKLTGRRTKKLGKLLNLQQLTPMNNFQRMGGWDPSGAFYSMGRMLEQGERDIRAFEVMAKTGEMAQFLQENADWVQKADGQGKDGLWYEVEIPRLVALERGNPPVFDGSVRVWMTPAQKIHLYLESKNQDNLRHMVGGRTFADKELYSRGERTEAFAKGTTIRMAPETVRLLVADMTDTELEMAHILERFYNETAKREINRVSNILYGYDKAMGSYYAPIYCNSNYTNREFGVFDVTAEGVGNLKGRQVSKNPSYNISCFDAFERSIDQTSRFVGMAIPARNWSVFFNFQSENTSLKNELDQKWGADAQAYIGDLITRLQGGESYDTDVISGFAGKVLSNYVSATFGFNPSIVLKQAGSLPMASAYLGWKNFPAMKKWRVDTELISKYTKELQWRTMGYATPETKMLKDNPGLMQSNKVLNFLTGGAITWADGGIAGILWPWAENKVRNEQPELPIGTVEQVNAGESPFYKAVAKEFNDAVCRSQSVSDETHQSSLRKSKNPITRAFTMFRSDSAQAYNMLRQKIGEASYYKQTGANRDTMRQAKGAIGAVLGAVLINAFWGEIVDFAMAALKNGAKYYRDEEDELTAESVGMEALSGLFESLSGIVVGGDSIYEAIGSGFLGNTSFELETPGMEQLGEIRDLAIGLGRNVKKFIAEAEEVRKAGGNIGQYWMENADEIAGIVKDNAQKMATYFAGVPLANLEKYLGGIVFRISPALEQAYEGLFSNADKSDISDLTGDALRVKIAELLRERRVSASGNTAEILSQLYETGYAEVIPSDVPGSVSINGVDHELDAGQKQAFGDAWTKIVAEVLDSVVSSDRFAMSSQNAQAKMISYLYGYAREMAKAELFDEYEPATRADTVKAYADAGMDMGDFLYAYAHYNEIYNRDLSAGEKATAFAHWLDGESYSVEEKKVIKDELVFYNMSPAEANRYDSFVESGLSKDEAADLAENIADLTPEEGKTQVSDVQRWRACVDFSTNEGVQLSALSSVMDADRFGKVLLAYEMGVSPDAYVGYYEIRVRYDADKNGAYTQKEVKNAINAMVSYKLTQTQKAVLWQLITGSGSAKNNPYSQTIGQKVIDAWEKAKAESESEGLSFQEEIMRQIMGR